MAFPRRSSRTPRSRFTLGLLLLTAVTILVLDLPGTGPLDPIRGAAAAVFRPIRSAAEAVFEPISNGWKGAFGYDEVEDENAALRRDLEDLKGQEAELARLERENRELKKIAGVDAGDIPVKTAEIVSGPLSSFDQTVEIDVGSGDSVKRGMAVITGGGVLGRIGDVRNGRATVDLLTDPSVSIGVRLPNGDLALASGQGRGKSLVVEGLEEDTKVEEGDFVYTSGIDRSAFPKDLYVGKVSKVNEATPGVPQTIEVEPSADFASRYVRVVLKEAPR